LLKFNSNFHGISISFFPFPAIGDNHVDTGQHLSI